MRSGYVKTNLFGREEYVHRIVAACFCGGPEDAVTVNHKDGNRSNNVADNLEWLSYSKNHKHSYAVLGREAGMKGRRKGRGYCFDKNRGKWIAYHDSADRRVYLGRFETEGEAVEAVKHFREEA